MAIMTVAKNTSGDVGASLSRGAFVIRLTRQHWIKMN